LTRLGHEVTLFASAGSDACGELVAALPGPYGAAGSPDDWQLCEWINLCRAVQEAGRFDVLHSHAYLWGIPLQKLAGTPMVHTIHVMPGDDQARLWASAPGACVTALSNYQWSNFPQFQPTAVIPHGLDTSQFPFQLEPDDYVCFLGRFNWGKGPLRAVEAARELGLRLLLAGPLNDYYRERIEPVVDGHSIQYIGSVSGPARSRLLGRARALLYPIQEPEPFGLVMAEAMMCGTPVVATRIGAVPDIVEEGVTGYCVEAMDDLPEQLIRSFTLDRRLIRETAEVRFSGERMARDYAEVYRRAAQGKP
jgi:glycosyltransferase involved in cell wall biosynthesis